MQIDVHGVPLIEILNNQAVFDTAELFHAGPPPASSEWPVSGASTPAAICLAEIEGGKPRRPCGVHVKVAGTQTGTAPMMTATSVSVSLSRAASKL